MSGTDTDSEIEAKPVEQIIEVPIKKKRVKTPAQVAAWEKALATRTINREKRATERETIYKEKLAKQEDKIAKRDKKIEIKVKKQISEKLLQSDAESDTEDDQAPIIIKKKRKSTKIIYVDSDDEEIEKTKNPIVIINKFDKPVEKPIIKNEIVKSSIRFL